MTLHVGMVADDLTGALDAAAPFAQRGLRTVVILTPDGLATADAAIVEQAEVICINTASREIAEGEARRRVAAATEALLALQPRLLFKKVDSRLKGHLGTELEAMLQASGRREIVLAPAIPDLGRFVVDGAVVGSGVHEPIPVLARCAGLPVSAPDTPDAPSLDVLGTKLVSQGATTVAAGARGLAVAIAKELPSRPARAWGRRMPQPALVAIGSRDPITRSQIDQAVRDVPLQRVMAPNGAVPRVVIGLGATMVTAEPGATAEPGPVISARFAQGIADLVEQRVPASLLISGGETANAVLNRLGVDLITLDGEASPGVPFATALIRNEQVVILTKSGGFGAPDAISVLLEGAVEYH